MDGESKWLVLTGSYDGPDSRRGLVDGEERLRLIEVLSKSVGLKNRVERLLRQT